MAVTRRFRFANTRAETDARLGRELYAPLAAARPEDGAASTGAHTKTKSVHLGAAAVVGLKSALAHGISVMMTVVIRWSNGGWPRCVRFFRGVEREQPARPSRLLHWEEGSAITARSQLPKNTGF